MLPLPVVIHLPHFFVSAASSDVVDVGFGDAGDSAAQASDDLIGKAVSDQARIILAGSFVVLLAQDLRGGGILGVEEPTVDRHAAPGQPQSTRRPRKQRWPARLPIVPGSSVAERRA